jgi:hypothetical protein
MKREFKAIRVSPEFHRELKVAAAKSGEDMNQIAERAIRKELELMTKHEGLTICYDILGGNLFADDRDAKGIFDEAASVARYAEQCQKALKGAFPGAEINVTYQLDVSGGDGQHLSVEDADGARYRPGDNGKLGLLAEEASDIVNGLWESWEWVLYYDLSTPSGIAEALNGYNGDPWEGIIYHLPEYDAGATEGADPVGRSDVVVLRDGTRIEWDEPTKRWAAH